MANLIGQTILNQYRVESFIASGGMGAVYRVIDLKRNCPLAMKVLHADLADDPTVFKRFQREAHALEQLRHPNVVSFYGLFQEKGQTFLLEEFIEGNSLQAILRERNGLPLPVDEVIIYMKGLCAALSYAHTNNIVHCDVKPGNVMVNRQGNIFLTDFGIARFVGATTTTTLGIAGTPAYMAPEQIVGRGISPVTDVYALGVVLFEMLTGQRPFRGTEPESEAGGDTPSERIRYAHLRLPPPDPRMIKDNLSPALSQVVLHGLTKEPANRFRGAQELYIALCQAAHTKQEQVSDETTIIGEYHEAPPITPVPGIFQSVNTHAPAPTQGRKKPVQNEGILLSKKQQSGLLTVGVIAMVLFCITSLIVGQMLGLFPAKQPTTKTVTPILVSEPVTSIPTSNISEVAASSTPVPTDTQQPTSTPIPATATRVSTATLVASSCSLESCDTSSGDVCLYGISPQPAELIISFKFKQELNQYDLPQLTVEGQKYNCDVLVGYPGRLFCNGASVVGKKELVLMSSTNNALCSGTFNIPAYVAPVPTKKNPSGKRYP